VRRDLSAYGTGAGTVSLFELREGALKYGAYPQEATGVIRGLTYAPLASYAHEVHALPATVHRHLAPEEIPGLLDEGRTVMASVHYEIRNPHRPAPGRGDHLVLLTGHTQSGVHFHNPSGTTPASRARGPAGRCRVSPGRRHLACAESTHGPAGEIRGDVLHCLLEVPSLDTERE
jgi:hypothetical protein